MQDKKTIIIIVGIVLLLCCCITGIAGTILFMGAASTYDGSSSTTTTTTTTSTTPSLTPEVSNIYDTFNTNSYKWYEDSINDEYGNITREITGGKYIWEFNAKKPVSKSASPSGVEQLADGEVSFDARVVSADAEATYGIQFRYTDTKNYYILRISEAAKMYSLLVMENGVYTNIVPWTADASIKATGNNLKVSFVGSKITIFVNNVEVKEVTDTTFTNGWCGINSEFYGTNQKATVEFDNFQMSKK